MTEVTPAECIPLPAPSITALPGRLQPPPPLGHRPWPRSCAEQLSTRCTAPRILFPGKRGRETARCSFPCISMGRMVGANAGQEFSQTQARHPGRWLLRGFAQLLQHCSHSRLCSGSPQRGCGCSDDGTGVPSSQRDALALQH